MLGITGTCVSVTANSCTENVQSSVFAIAAAVCGANIESLIVSEFGELNVRVLQCPFCLPNVKFLLQDASEIHIPLI